MTEKTKESEKLTFPSEENFEYKGMQYVIRHTYKNSGDNLMNVLKKQLLNTLENTPQKMSSCYNNEVNILGF